jgi:DNA topoisomerase-1
VTKFLQRYLPDFVDLKFTRKMEEVLDEIAAGDKGYLEYLNQLYKGKNGLAEMVKAQEKSIDPAEAREIKLPPLEQFKFRVGRFGAYVCKDDGGKEVCASIPDQVSPADLTAEKLEELIQQKMAGADALGKDPETGKAIYLLTGRYGPYVQLGDQETGEKPKAVSLPQGLDPSEVTLEKALFLLSLPRLLGTHPESGEKIFLGNGRFGPFVKMQNEFRSIPKGEDFFTFDLKKALDLLATPKKPGRGRSVAKVLRTLGLHPENQEPIEILDGKYGPYCKWGKIHASLPKDRPVDQVTLEEVLPLLDEKLAKNPSKGFRRSVVR